jgi:hypothetical protein
MDASAFDIRAGLLDNRRHAARLQVSSTLTTQYLSISFGSLNNCTVTADNMIYSGELFAGQHWRFENTEACRTAIQ